MTTHDQGLNLHGERRDERLYQGPRTKRTSLLGCIRHVGCCNVYYNNNYSRPCAAPHCMVLPLGQLNGITSDLLTVLSHDVAKLHQVNET